MIPKLNTKQVELLEALTQTEKPILGLYHPKPDDPQFKKSRMKENVKNINELIKLGLLKDITKKCKRDIEQLQKHARPEDVGRKLRIISMTTMALQMFDNADERVVN